MFTLKLSTMACICTRDTIGHNVRQFMFDIWLNSFVYFIILLLFKKKIKHKWIIYIPGRKK
jgi:hypothetical protein